MYDSIYRAERYKVDRPWSTKNLTDNLPVPFGFGEAPTQEHPMKGKAKVDVDWDKATNVIAIDSLTYNEGVIDMKKGEVRWYSYRNDTERERMQTKISAAMKKQGMEFNKRAFRGLFYVERI